MRNRWRTLAVAVAGALVLAGSGMTSGTAVALIPVRLISAGNPAPVKARVLLYPFLSAAAGRAVIKETLATAGGVTQPTGESMR